VQRDLDPFMQAMWSRFEVRIGEYRKWNHKWPRRLIRPDLAVKQDETGFFAVNSPKYPAYKELVVVDARGEELQPRLITHSADKIVLNYLRHFTTIQLDEIDDWKSWLGWTHRKIHEAFPFVKTNALRNALQRVSTT